MPSSVGFWADLPSLGMLMTKQKFIHKENDCNNALSE